MFFFSKIKTVLHGVIMGIAEIVPGVSASTATLLLGIYDDFIDLLDGVTSFIKDFLRFLLKKESKQNVIKSFKNIKFKYGIELFIGMVIGILIFSNIVSYLYKSNEQVVRAVFFGIILASIIIPYKIVKKPKINDILFFIIGFVAFFSILKMGQVGDAETLPLWLVFVGGSISVSGMVLPGVNSSFLLIPLGIYELILNILSEFSKFNFEKELIIQAFVFALGLAFGLITFVKILKYAFEFHVTKLFSLIGGIMIASLANLWPLEGVESFGAHELLISVLMLVSLFLTSIFILKTKPEEELNKK